ncbi:MAG: serine hydroxymethyltransferase, partial [Deltaproteobacteria bacterium]|nr:serine hydroxymethyltransferase [Deltaproteobacteria bacterium]
PRIIDFAVFAEIAGSVGALLMVDMAHIAGLVAAELHPSPIPYADFTTSTTHKTLRGPRGGLILAKSEFGARLNKELFPGIQGGPLMHVIAAKALAFKEALASTFTDYQADVVKNAKALAGHLVENGVQLVSGGTDNHMMLVDLSNLGVTGKDAEAALGKARITVNKNTIPFDTLGPAVTSGIRVGSPAITSRGMKAAEMAVIARLMVDVLKNMGDDRVVEKVNNEIRELCEAFPIYT